MSAPARTRTEGAVTDGPAAAARPGRVRGRGRAAHVLPAPGQGDGNPLHAVRQTDLHGLHDRGVRGLPLPGVRPRRVRHGPPPRGEPAADPGGRERGRRPQAGHQDPSRHQPRRLHRGLGFRPLAARRPAAVRPGLLGRSVGRRRRSGGGPVVPAADVDVPAPGGAAHRVQHAGAVVARRAAGSRARQDPVSGALSAFGARSAARSPTGSPLPRRGRSAPRVPSSACWGPPPC